ncbi:MAG: M20/M25/M40 family metallo-hydrolase [Bryobacteraceae bacterium]|nr:M20/M25/M40 family metallo-hydrolase [Bryobacteraceae bacterium]
MRRLALLLSLAALAPAAAQEIDAERIRAHTRFLASDLLEGRGVGSRGELLATEYLATQLALIGAKPAGDMGTFFQRVPLVGVETQPTATLSAAGKTGGLSYKWLEDFVGVTQQQNPNAAFDAEAVFVGHGITAPEFGWDDYKGIDVTGKVVVLFTNEPPSTDPNFFGGRALTYYGRWTYKYEQAIRKGAVACLIIHTTPTAGYGWDVVRSSWGREDFQVKAEGPQLAFAGWISTEGGGRLAKLAGKTLDELLRAADSRGFKAFPLGIRIKGSIPSKIRQIETRNVVGKIPGSDETLKDEAVIFSAHWDHLGVGRPVNGDAIYNGAVDNATGCAIVLEIARAWASLEHKPKRSALFLFVTAEESGLRGSEYYARKPVVSAGKTALAVNFDAFYPFGRTRDVVVNGAERTTVWPVVQNVAKRLRLEIKPDPRPEQGTYYRSDHFSFAKAGIPAFSVSMGTQFEGKPVDFGNTVFQEYNSKNYHQPSDEYREDWDFSGLEEIAKFGFLIGADAAALPTWRPNDEFLPARKKSGVN